MALFLVALAAWADSVEMQNGNRYNGKVVSVTSSNLVLQGDILGVVCVPRSKVAHVVFGTNFFANSELPALSSPAESNVTSVAEQKEAADFPASLRQLGAHTNLIQGVRSKFLSDADPEAINKFNQMLQDLITGKMNIADLRAQAKTAADQLRSLQREAGDDTSGMMKLYLSILDHFVREAGPTNNPATNSTVSSPKPPS